MKNDRKISDYVGLLEDAVRSLKTSEICGMPLTKTFSVDDSIVIGSAPNILKAAIETINLLEIDKQEALSMVDDVLKITTSYSRITKILLGCNITTVCISLAVMIYIL